MAASAPHIFHIGEPLVRWCHSPRVSHATATESQPYAPGLIPNVRRALSVVRNIGIDISSYPKYRAKLPTTAIMTRAGMAKCCTKLSRCFIVFLKSFSHLYSITDPPLGSRMVAMVGRGMGRGEPPTHPRDYSTNEGLCPEL